MKSRFNGYDITCAIAEIRSILGYRVNQIYDLDNKTFIIKFNQNEDKKTLLFESGVRIHITNFTWPKSLSPSGFTMKLRKHLKNKRLEEISQLGCDRIIQLQFGTGIASYYIILELFDRGNIILCDNSHIILNVLRPHSEGEDVRFAVKETYNTHTRARQDERPSLDMLREKIIQATPGETLRTILNPILPCGSSLIDHVLLLHGINECKIAGELTDDGNQKKKKKNKKIGSNLRDFNIDKEFQNLVDAVNDVFKKIDDSKNNVSPGYIIQRKEQRPTMDGGEEWFYTNLEFHPFLYQQFANEPVKEFPTFLQAVDEFFSSVESQKIDLKALAQEKEALKKLSNIRDDHKKRLNELTKNQMIDRQKAELIIRNQYLVDSAIHAIQKLIAQQMSWNDIEAFIKERQENEDELAMTIKKLKFHCNEITLHLIDPFLGNEDALEEDEQMGNEEKLQPMDVNVDLSLSAFANATRYYEMKRSAAKKEQKTIEASGKALKSAEKKTQQTLKDVNIQATITKARKNYWFEKFFWFISSENYLVICGRDQQQNELLVKKYLRPNDIYVHAEIQGASSVIIKNPSGNDVPPKTLNEAGTSATCYSVAWDAKVVCLAYYVYAHQVSKTAPTGEYLTTGSFMIRGKKNFLPPSHLILGLGILFKLEDSSVERHRGERQIRKFEDDLDSVVIEDQEILLNDSDSEDEQLSKETENKLEIIREESDAPKENESSNEFPDTHIKFEHATGEINIQYGPKPETKLIDQNQEESIIHGGPMKVKKVEVKFKPPKKQKNQQPSVEAKKDEKNGPKRGQKGKLKKIKEKYKNQDDEDRAIIMGLLQSSGSNNNQKSQEENEKESSEIAKKKLIPRNQQTNSEDIDEVFASDEVDMLETLTGCPVDEDELLFAVPIVAPYNTLTNYKFKVKLTPGSGRRGKASKAALQIFLRDKSTSAREKDLIKAIKEDVLARNMPGKVKISAPQLQKHLKK